MSDRVILHCDMNSFFCSVELLEHPELKDKPVAVAGRADARHGIILAKNQLAKSYGVVTPEPIVQALRKCPGLILLDPHHEKYEEFCHRINQIYLSYTDQVEPFSIDESWLDVTGSLRYFGKNGRELADEIRMRVFKETGLTLSVGVSFNKTFAKMGSDYKKPDATTEITRENFRELLWPLPAGDLFFVGKATSERLLKMNIRTIGDIANTDEVILEKVFGKSGIQMHLAANGVDGSPVLPYDTKYERKSVGNGITFRRDLVGKDDVRTAVTAISDRVAARLRKHSLKCGGVKVDIKDPNFVSISRQMPLAFATALSSDIAAAAMALIEANWSWKNPIRLITVTGINLSGSGEEDSSQISFFEEADLVKKRNNAELLENAVDRIREKMGRSAITHGSLIDNDLGIIIENEK